MKGVQVGRAEGKMGEGEGQGSGRGLQRSSREGAE